MVSEMGSEIKTVDRLNAVYSLLILLISLQVGTTR